jgi:hypothetical protein
MVRPTLIYLAWRKIVGPLVLRSSGEIREVPPAKPLHGPTYCYELTVRLNS